MKKILSLILVLCFCLTMTVVLASCDDTTAGTDETTTAGGEDAGEGTTIPTPDPMILRPADCSIVNGGTEEELKVEEAGNLGYWKAGNTATWTVNTLKAGKYKIVINYAKGTTQDAEVVITAGESKASARVPVTTDWTTYVDFEVGTIDLVAGDNTLVVAPGEMPESDLMNLLTLTLTYVE